MKRAHSRPALEPSSLLISSRNRPELLIELVRSVLAGDETPAEIVIIDQSDRRHPVLSSLKPGRPARLRYLWAPSRGASRGRNAAIAAARHDVLVFADDDMLAPPGWFGAIVRALAAAGPNGVVTGRVLPLEDGHADGDAPSTKIDLEPAIYEGRIDRDVLYTGNMALRRSAVWAAGGFDERLGPGTRFPASEDSDLGLRLLNAGFTIHYRPEAVLYHRAWRTGSALLRLHWDYGVGRGAYYAKHWLDGVPGIPQRLGRDLARTLAECAGRLFRQPGGALHSGVTAFGILFGAARWAMQPSRVELPTAVSSRARAARVRPLL